MSDRLTVDEQREWMAMLASATAPRSDSESSELERIEAVHVSTLLTTMATNHEEDTTVGVTVQVNIFVYFSRDVLFW